MKLKTLERYEQLNTKPRSPENIRRRNAIYQKVMQEMHLNLRKYSAFAAISESNEIEDALMQALQNIRTAVDTTNQRKRNTKL